MKLYRNIGTSTSPIFDAGTLLEVGPPGSGSPINVGSRACPSVIDWNSDGRKDLIVGAMDGRVHLFLNEGTDAEPTFTAETFVQEGGSDLFVRSARSSPVVIDYDNDGRKDLITGNTDGQLLFYRNIGTDAAPVFDGYVMLQSEGVVIDLVATRSRPFVCDWNGDGQLDVLIGCSDGSVYLFPGVPEPATMSLLGLGGLGLLIRRKR